MSLKRTGFSAESRARSAAKAREKARTAPRKPLKRTSTMKRRPVSPASDAQREKVSGAVSIVSGRPGCDPAHIWPRSLGGCDSALCVVPLNRDEHNLYEAGELDILPFLIRERKIPELQHALAHADGSLLRLIREVTGVTYVPADEL